MKLINKILPDGQIKPIIHLPDDSNSIGKIMTNTELHEFGITLLIGYLLIQDFILVQPTGNLSNENEHMIVKAPNGQMFDFWVKTVMYPQIPTIELFKNHRDIIILSAQINAILLFAGIRLSCLSNDNISLPINGGGYKFEFAGLKEF